MVTGPEKSTERHPGSIPNTLLLKTGKRCAYVHFLHHLLGSLVGFLRAILGGL